MPMFENRTRKVVLMLVCVTVLSRACMLYMNYRQHPDFFNRSPESISREMSTASLPYANTFGYEVGNVAYSIVCKKQGFSNPFGGDTGPTGWVAPGLVYLYAGAFSLFGCFSLSALYSMFLLSMALSVAMVLLIYNLCLSLYNNKTIAFVSALVFSLCSQDILLFGKSFQQDFNVYTFFFLITFYLFVKYLKQKNSRNLLLFAVVTAGSLYFMPVLLFAVAACFPIVLFAFHKNRIVTGAKHILLISIILFLVSAPYILHQKTRLGVWSFFKSNAVYELYQGNSADYQGVLTVDVFKTKHPAVNASEYRDYASMGEVDYVRSRGKLFFEEFQVLRFIRLAVNRIIAFYLIFVPYITHFGLTAWILLNYIIYALPGIAVIICGLLRYKKLSNYEWLILIYIVGYSLPYIMTGIMYRYSFPISALTSVFWGRIIFEAVTKKNPQIRTVSS